MMTQTKEVLNRTNWLMLIMLCILAGSFGCNASRDKTPISSPTPTPTPTPLPTPTPVETLETEIRAIIQKYFDAWEQGDYEKMYDFLQTDVEQVLFVSNNERLPIPVHGLSIESIDLGDEAEVTVVFNVRTPNWGCILTAMQSDDPVGMAQSLRDESTHVLPQRDTLVLSKRNGDWKIHLKTGEKKSNKILTVLYEVGFLARPLPEGDRDKLALGIMDYVREFEIPEDGIENITELLIEEMRRCGETSAQDEHCKLGFDALNQKDYEQVVSELSLCIDSNPKYAAAFDARGLAHVGLGEYQRAIEDFSRTIELDPDTVEVHFFRGSAYKLLDQCDLGLKDFAETIERDSDPLRRADAYESSGDCLCDMSRCDEAIEFYTKAILIPRADILVCISYYQRGKAYAALGQHEEALMDLQTARDLHELCQRLVDQDDVALDLLPRPTVTPAGGESPTPTRTLKPTRMPTPTRARAPTRTPAPSVLGIGVSRNSIQSAFEDLGFEFETEIDAEGQPIATGKVPSGLAIVGLVGPPDNLVSTAIMISPPSDELELVTSIDYMLLLLELATSDWEGRMEWLMENLDTAFETGEARTT